MENQEGKRQQKPSREQLKAETEGFPKREETLDREGTQGFLGGPCVKGIKVNI